MSKDLPKVIGLCGRDLETKSWKQGTKVQCNRINLSQVSYPNYGIQAHVRRFCRCCLHSGEKMQ